MMDPRQRFNCPLCHGDGRTKNLYHASGNSLCNVCQGKGTILESIDAWATRVDAELIRLSRLVDLEQKPD